MIDLDAAHKHSFKNREEVLRSEVCGCFCCEETFPPSEITEWTDKAQSTAVCPKCKVDAVIGSASNISLTKEFLSSMYSRWFRCR